MKKDKSKGIPVKDTDFSELIPEGFNGPVFAGTVEGGMFYPATPEETFEKIIVVTGQPRSGTSLAMRTLDILGFPVTGRPDDPPIDDIDELKEKSIDKKDRAKLLNPRGFYETNQAVKGVRKEVQAMRLAGKIVKIVTMGIVKTNPAYIGKIVLCLRDPREIAQSQKKLASNMIIKADEGAVFSPEALKASAFNYVRQMGRLVKYLKDKDVSDIFVLNFEDMFSENNRELITKLSEFLGKRPDEKQLDEALENIKPELYRSVKAEWPDDENSRLAMKIYEKLKALDFQELPELIPWFENLRAKNRQWIDDFDFGLWQPIGNALYKQLKTNPDLAAVMLKNSDREDEKNKTRPYHCPHYSRSNGNLYTVERGEGIPDLERELVSCDYDDDLKPLEYCYTCWNKGWGAKGYIKRKAMKILCIEDGSCPDLFK